MPCSHITDLRWGTCQFTLALVTFLNRVINNMSHKQPCHMLIYRNERLIEVYVSLFCVFPGRKTVEAVRADSSTLILLQ